MSEEVNEQPSAEFIKPVLEVNNRAIRALAETRKWSFFLAVIGIVILSFIIMLALFAGALINNLAGIKIAGYAVTFLYLLIALLYFFPVMYCYKFSVLMKPALVEHNAEKFADAIANLKSLFKYYGILMIIVLSMYVVFGVVFAIAKMVF